MVTAMMRRKCCILDNKGTVPPCMRMNVKIVRGFARNEDIASRKIHIEQVSRSNLFNSHRPTGFQVNIPWLRR